MQSINQHIIFNQHQLLVALYLTQFMHTIRSNFTSFAVPGTKQRQAAVRGHAFIRSFTVLILEMFLHNANVLFLADYLKLSMGWLAFYKYPQCLTPLLIRNYYQSFWLNTLKLSNGCRDMYICGPSGIHHRRFRASEFTHFLLFIIIIVMMAS